MTLALLLTLVAVILAGVIVVSCYWARTRSHVLDEEHRKSNGRLRDAVAHSPCGAWVPFPDSEGAGGTQYEGTADKRPGVAGPRPDPGHGAATDAGRPPSDAPASSPPPWLTVLPDMYPLARRHCHAHALRSLRHVQRLLVAKGAIADKGELAGLRSASEAVRVLIDRYEGDVRRQEDRGLLEHLYVGATAADEALARVALAPDGIMASVQPGDTFSRVASAIAQARRVGAVEQLSKLREARSDA